MADLGGADVFRVLIVDDDSVIRKSVRAAVASISDLEVSEADSLPAAKETVAELPFHLALVDLDLSDSPSGELDGLALIKHLYSDAPSCQVIVLSRLVGVEQAMRTLVHPRSIGFIDGILDKRANPPIAEIVRARFLEWRERRVTCPDLDRALRALDDKAHRFRVRTPPLRPSEAARVAEMRDLLADVFGDLNLAPHWATLGNDEHRDRLRPVINLTQVHRGHSAAVVFEVDPSLGGTDESPIAGNRCVLKIGPRSLIADELRRYAAVVRFGVPLQNRVELLGHGLRDALGGACYSFAGEGERAFESFDQLLDGALDSVETLAGVVKKQLGLENKRWYSVPGPKVGLSVFFHSRRTGMGSGPLMDEEEEVFLEGRKRTLAWANRNARELGFHVSRDPDAGTAELVLDNGQRVELPDDRVLADGAMMLPRETCLSHGDMHGGNLLIDATHSPWLIDYAKAGFAPRCLDFVSLLGSLRRAEAREAEQLVSRSNETESMARREQAKVLLMAARSERDFWNAVAEGKAEDLVARKLQHGQSTPCLELSQVIVACLRDNFEHEGLTVGELMWTCLAFCLWQLAIEDLDDFTRLRLVAWLDGLLSMRRVLDRVTPPSEV